MFVYTDIEILPSETKLRQGNVFTGVYQLFCSWEVSASVHAGIHTPWADPTWKHTPWKHIPLKHTPPPEAHPSPWNQTPPRRSLQQTVRILLECFLFNSCISPLITYEYDGKMSVWRNQEGVNVKVVPHKENVKLKPLITFSDKL